MPAIPVITAIGSGVAAAAPVLAAGAGIYSDVKGVQAQEDAVAAAQNQARAAAGAGTNLAQSQDANLQAYFNSNPAFAAEYNRHMAQARPGTDNRTQTQWLSDFLRDNPEEQQKFQSFAASGGVIPSSAMGPGGTVDVNILQQQAQAVAQQNAAAAKALEDQYNPGASALRETSLQALIDKLAAQNPGPVGTLPSVPEVTALPTSGTNEALLAQIAAQAGQPLQNVGYDSPLTRDAIAKARADLALGGLLPQDVRNMVARNAFARSGMVSGGTRLGRDITARDLGLTSLDLERARLQAALQAGSAEAGLEGANAAMRLSAEQYARENLLRSQVATAQDLAVSRAAAVQQQQLAQQAAAQQAQNYFNDNSLRQSIIGGDFARALAAAQLGQNIAQPQAGLSPGSVADVAIGNVNLANNAQQQANAAAAQAGAQKAQFGTQLIGAAINPAIDALKNIFQPTPVTTLPTTTVGYDVASSLPGFKYSSLQGFSPATY